MQFFRALANLVRLPRESGGSVLVEFAMAVPVFVGLLLGGIEVARYALAVQKLDRVAASVADLVARLDGVTTADLDDVFAAARLVAAPLDMAGRGRVIVSAIADTGTGDRVHWQRLDGGALTAASSVGVAGGFASVPGAITIPDGESIVVAEVVYAWSPLLVPWLGGERTLRQRAVHRPRLVRVLDLTP
ncbi:MAG: TadE/TadG family type IV pilus assembly protein [Alphaproteobacteria bacterium]